MARYEPPTALPREFLERPEVRAALAAHNFGAVFRIARSEAGISYSKIAAECDMKPDRVGILARGVGSVTTFEKIARISDALRIPGNMLGLAPRQWESDPLHACTAPNTDGKGSEAVHRREFFKASAAAGIAIGLPEIESAKPGARIGRRIPEQLRMRAARLRRLDEVLGGADTYHVYLGEFLATKKLARESVCSESTEKALQSVMAEQAQQAGWAAFDAGSHVDAASLYEESHELAKQSGDFPLAGNALAFLAYQQAGDEFRSVIETADESCRTAGPDAPSSVRALLYERLAWAYAVSGQASETERALSVAEAALAEGGACQEPQPDWAAWVDHTEIQIMIGRCWTELGRPLRAVPALERALSGYGDTFARDKSLYLSWLAEAYLSAGEVEQAAHTTMKALSLAAGVASVRPRQRITPVVQKLGAYKKLPAVADVLELVNA
ncbi:XRE family transcriptional regulator [Streptomyces sp. NPDC059153]|uniref:XRE family transcriptional regulator n=1 Tax=Streptomyces sp. NPDC059153 TaxID=3346743 RepID=UPI0036B45353